MGDRLDRDLVELLGLGKMLDARPELLGGRTTSVFLAQVLLRIRRRDGTSFPLVPNRVQLEYERRRGRSNIVLKARQMGISTWIAGQFFLKTITRPGTMTVQVAHTHDAARAIFRIVQRFVDCLPPDMKKGTLRTSRTNARQLVFPALDSEYRVESAGDKNAGRGITIQNLHCSEVARWPGDPAETLGGLRAAMPQDGELVLESTPDGMAGCFYEEWVKAAAFDSGVVRHFFPWWWEPGYVASAVEDGSLTSEERRLISGHDLTHQQIGYRRGIAARFGELAAQEYAEDPDACFLSSGSCVFDSGAIDQRLRSAPDPLTRRFNGDLLVWNPPVAGRTYLVAVDPAGGGADGDFSAVQVIDMATGMQCAELQSKLGTLELAQQAAVLARAYNHALLAVERNNHGSGVLAYLNSVCRYDRMYQQDGQDGWLTTSLSRPGMIGALVAALVEQPGIFQSRRLLRECRSFVRLKNGKTGAQAGSHDDCVMAMALGLSVRADLVQRGLGRRNL
ncbi:MAG TPA: terminase [Acidisarcina sp.]